MSKQRVDMDFAVRNFMQIARRGVKPTNSRVYGADAAPGLANLERTANHAGNIAKAYFSDLDKIDKEIAPEYRVAKRREAARQTFANLQKFEEDEIAPLRKRIEGLRGRAMADLNSRRAVKAQADTDAGRLLLELRQRELRDRLVHLETLQVEAIYRSGDEFMRSAIENAPPRIVAPKGGLPRSEPLISPNLVTETRTAQAMAEAPAIVEELAELEAVEATLTQVAAAAKKGVQASVEFFDLAAPKAKTPIEIR